MHRPRFLTAAPRTLAATFAAATTIAGLVAPPPAGASSVVPTGEVRIGSLEVVVELIVTAEGGQRGLSERDAVAKGTDGMYFRAAGEVGFWMKDMRFCLDLIWIADGAVLGTTENACPPPPNTDDADIPIFYPPAAIDGAIEVPAGWVAAHGIAAGMPVSPVSVPPSAVRRMIDRAARDGQFDPDEIAAVAGTMAYVGADSFLVATRMEAVNDGKEITPREVKRVAKLVRAALNGAAPRSRTAAPGSAGAPR